MSGWIQRLLWDKLKPKRALQQPYLCVNGPYAGKRLTLSGPSTAVFKVGGQKGYYQGSPGSDLLKWKEVE